MKPIVAIAAFDRTELFAECLNRLGKNDYNFDVLIAPDKSITRDAVEIDRIIRESKLEIKTLPRPPLRLGADKNIINSVNAAADMGYSHIICLGSDILVSENFIHDLMALSVKFDAFSAIPTTGRHSLETKLEHVNSLVHGANTGQNFCCPVHIWRNISPLVTAISDRFYKIKYDAHEHWCQRLVMRVLLDAARKIETPFTKPMLDHMDANEIGTSEDGLITTVLAMYGIPMVSYAINRACHPSDTGVNTTREHYEQHYAGVTIDALPKADPEKFKFIQ